MATELVSKESLKTRLSRIEGQVRGLQKMIAEEKDCESILVQMAAVRGGIESVGSLILKNYMTLCVNNRLAGEVDSVEALSRAIAIWMKSRGGYP